MSEFEDLVKAAERGDLETIRTMVANGFDLSMVNQFGESVLAEAISNFSVYDDMSPYRSEVAKLLLELGANPNQLDEDGCGSLTEAALSMDTELLRVLLEAGARPNDFSGFGGNDTLYDWIDMDYVFHIWDYNKIPEEPSQEVLDDEDKWLNWIDSMAVKYQRRRPDHLFLLRQYGARCRWELNQIQNAKTQ